MQLWYGDLKVSLRLLLRPAVLLRISCKEHKQVNQYEKEVVVQVRESATRLCLMVLTLSSFNFNGV